MTLALASRPATGARMGVDEHLVSREERKLKIERTTTLNGALEQVTTLAEWIKAGGPGPVDGREYKMDDEVSLEIEFEVKDNSPELEFEIKWRRAAEGQPSGEEQHNSWD